MIRLRNPDVSRLQRELRRYLCSMGYTDPLPAYRKSQGEQHFAMEDLVNSILCILGSPGGTSLPLPASERVEAVQQPAGSRPETVRDGEESIDLGSNPAPLDGADSRAI